MRVGILFQSDQILMGWLPSQVFRQYLYVAILDCDSTMCIEKLPKTNFDRFEKDSRPPSVLQIAVNTSLVQNP